jgi:acyl dehydratase
MNRAVFATDFDSLREGDAFSTPERSINESDLALFAALTGDHHPQHTDAEWAAHSPFGERIAHGMLVLSYAIGLVPLDPERVVALRRLKDVVFKRPVCIGEAIRVEGRIASKQPLDRETGLVGSGWRIVGRDSHLVARATLEVVWRRDVSDPKPGEQELEPVLRSSGESQRVYVLL